MKHSKLIQSFLIFLLAFSFSIFAKAEDEFKPAYANIEEIEEEIETAEKYFVRHQGRNYYTSGKENGIRVFENNEESTDETVGILTFLIAPATIVYMNIEGWWD